MSFAKEELIKIIEEQPEDSSSEEIVRELLFHIMILRGLADADAGRVISNDEMARRIQAWAK
jgi:predicted transcriptional regulator